MSPGAIRIALSGPRVVDAAGAREYPLPRKTLNVLAYLILRKRAPTRDAAAFSRSFPTRTKIRLRNSLRRNLSYLLSSLPPNPGSEPFIRTDGDRLEWNLAAAAEVDVLAFERAIAEGRDDDALAVYAGPRLAEVAASSDRLDDALLGFAAARTALHDLGFPRSVAEIDTLVARANAELGNESGVRAAIAEFERIVATLGPERARWSTERRTKRGTLRTLPHARLALRRRSCPPQMSNVSAGSPGTSISLRSSPVVTSRFGSPASAPPRERRRGSERS